MLNMGRRRGKTLKLVYRSEQFVLQKPVRSPGAIWPLLNPFKCIKTQHFSLSLVCSQKRADIQGGWPTKISYCCTHWTLFSAWKSAENFHNAGCQHQQSSMSWSGLPQSHFWSFGSARNCSLVLLVLRMLILGRAEQSRQGWGLSTANNWWQGVFCVHISLNNFLSAINASHHVMVCAEKCFQGMAKKEWNQFCDLVRGTASTEEFKISGSKESSATLCIQKHECA